MTKESEHLLHIGIIMDGNGRWATNQGLPRLSGHSAGVDSLKEIVRSCPKLGVSTLTLFAFAIANWKRDQQEVDGLWQLFHQLLDNEAEDFIKEGVRIKIIGRRNTLPEDIKKRVEKVERDSAQNQDFMLQIALNYDGVDEVARMLQTALADGVSPTSITPEYVLSHLDTGELPAPDILLRTGMQPAQEGMSTWRGSAFLPLQSTQSVCVSTEVLWPDITCEHLEKIIVYAKPESRLFGGQRQ